MKRLLVLGLVSLVLLPHAQAWASGFETVEGKVACTSQGHLKEFNAFLASDDKASAMAYLTAMKCMPMKGGQKVTLLDTDGFLLMTMRFSFLGQQFWANRDGLAPIK
jgi:hypothetical protein